MCQRSCTTNLSPMNSNMTETTTQTRSRISFTTKRNLILQHHSNVFFYRTGLVGIRTNGNAFQFTKRPLVVVYYNIDYVKDSKGANYWRNRVFKVAQDYKRKLQFSVSHKEEFSQVCTFIYYSFC
jgi:hypothetical protein